MKTHLITSVSLPADVSRYWQKHHKEILLFAERYLRLRMRRQVRRSTTRSYNRSGTAFAIVTTRFTPAEYDTLHYVAAALRVSVSSLVAGLIKLWLKPSRRAIQRFFATNYDWHAPKWDPEAGFIEENLTFWRINHKNTLHPPNSPLQAQ